MKRVLASVLVVVLTVVAGGCASSGQAKKQATVSGLGVVKNDITTAITQIDATTASLNALATPANGDLNKSFKDYSKQIATLEKSASRVRARNQELKAKTKAYFATWEKSGKSIKSDEVKAISLERRAAAQASFDAMTLEIAKGKAAFTPLMDELKDIQLYLSNDLTPAGVAATEPLAKSASANAAKVKESLGKVVAELSRVESELSPVVAK